MPLELKDFPGDVPDPTDDASSSSDDDDDGDDDDDDDGDDEVGRCRLTLTLLALNDFSHECDGCFQTLPSISTCAPTMRMRMTMTMTMIPASVRETSSLRADRMTL